MNQTIGFIGAGNMGKAIMKGIISAELTAPNEVAVYDPFKPALEAIYDELGVTITTNEKEVIHQANMIILAVKPNLIEDILQTVQKDITEEKVIVSIAAGVTIDQISNCLPDHAKVVRVMPNTPALVGSGMSALCLNEYVTDEDKHNVLAVFESFGKAEIVDEHLIDAVVGVSGSAPAYVYMFIEALADGAVVMGMSRSSAYTFAAQAVLGSAQMVLETEKHPGELKDMVTSPGGTTIAAVKSLENDNFRSAVINAVVAAAEKNKSM